MNIKTLQMPKKILIHGIANNLLSERIITGALYKADYVKKLNKGGQNESNGKFKKSG